MSINPRTALAGLLSVALMAACNPALARGPGGGGGVHAGASFHSSFSHANFAHPSFHSGNIGHNWSMATPHIAARTGFGTVHNRSFVANNRSLAVNNGNWGWGNNRFYGNNWRRGNFNWNRWWRYGYVLPWVGLGIGPGYYDYGYGYPYYDTYGYGYPSYDYFSYGYPYGGDYYGCDYNVAPDIVSTPQPAETEMPVEREEPTIVTSEASGFQAQALSAFQEGDYQNAVRLATHAVVDEPNSQEAHLLLSLALFAVGQYRGAATEAHAVVALGPTPNWPAVLSIYNDNVTAYTEQLRALEKYVRDNLSSPAGRFLLGFQYMIDGHKAVASDQLLEALQLAPRDSIAAQLLTIEGGTVPANIASQLQSARQPTPPPAKQEESNIVR